MFMGVILWLRFVGRCSLTFTLLFLHGYYYFCVGYLASYNALSLCRIVLATIMEIEPVRRSFIADFSIHFLPHYIIFDWAVFKDSKVEDLKS